MGKRGPKPKDPERRQRRNRDGAPGGAVIDLVLVDGNPLVVDPPPPRKRSRDWLAVTCDGWLEFWSTDVAAAVDVADLPALYRLFDLRDEHERLARAYRKNRFVEGSKGQPVTNPAYTVAQAMRPEIRALEDRFGANPTARARMTVGTSSAGPSVDDLNAAAADVGLEPIPDPRVAGGAS